MEKTSGDYRPQIPAAHVQHREPAAAFSSLVKIRPLPSSLHFICESSTGTLHRSSAYFMECSKGHISCRDCVLAKRKNNDDSCGYITRERGDRKPCEGRMQYETSDKDHDAIELYKPCSEPACGGWHKLDYPTTCNTLQGIGLLAVLADINRNVSLSKTAVLIQSKTRNEPGFQVSHVDILCSIQSVIDEWQIKGFPRYFNAPLHDDPTFCPERATHSLGIYNYPASDPSLIFNAPLLWGKLTTEEWQEIADQLQAMNIHKKVIVEAGAGTGYASLMLAIRGFKTRPVDHSANMYWPPDGGYFLPFTDTDLRAIASILNDRTK